MIERATRLRLALHHFISRQVASLPLVAQVAVGPTAPSDVQKFCRNRSEHPLSSDSHLPPGVRAILEVVEKEELLDAHELMEEIIQFLEQQIPCSVNAISGNKAKVLFVRVDGVIEIGPNSVMRAADRANPERQKEASGCDCGAGSGCFGGAGE